MIEEGHGSGDPNKNESRSPGRRGKSGAWETFSGAWNYRDTHVAMVMASTHVRWKEKKKSPRFLLQSSLATESI